MYLNEVFNALPQSALADLPGHDFKWVCLLDYKDQKLGFCTTGWVTELLPGTFYIWNYSQQVPPLSWLTMTPLTEIRQKIAARAVELGISFDLFDHISIEELLLTEINSNVGASISRAAGWLMEDPDLFTETLLDALKRALDGKYVPWADSIRELKKAIKKGERVLKKRSKAVKKTKSTAG